MGARGALVAGDRRRGGHLVRAEPEPGGRWSVTFTARSDDDGGHEVEEDEEDEDDDAYGSGVPEEDLRRAARVDEILGDLQSELMTAPPPQLDAWSDDHVSRYVAGLRADLRIARELNPEGRPTLRLDGEDVSLPMGGLWPGFSGRAWVWGPGEAAHSEVLGVDRQVVVRDRIRRRTLVTGVVTVVRAESGRVEVRAATAAEAERVLAAERIGG